MKKERLTELTQIFADHQEILPELFAMDAPDAVKKLADMSIAVTLDELLEFGAFMNKMKAQQESGELDEDALEDVSGGSATAIVLAGICFGYWAFHQKW
jgi:hypothetical protein